MTPARAVPAFQDNYLWLLPQDGCAAAVDPGDAAPMLAALAADGLRLTAILLTHHHADHIGGVARLRAEFPRIPVYGPADERVPATVRVREGDAVRLDGLGRAFRVLEVPGHTRSHIAYLGGGELYCGDTLFAGGCGRLFEGTPAQMRASLAKLRALPDATRAYCAHEYTQANLAFAQAVEPDNAELAAYRDEVRSRRARGEATVPMELGREKRCNPFLRWDRPAVVRAAEARAGRAGLAPDEVFGEIRSWKDGF